MTDRGAGSSGAESSTPAATSPPARRDDQRGDGVDGVTRHLPVGAALEAARGLGGEVEPTRRAAHRDGIEVGRLEQHVAGGDGDLGGGAPHHSGDRDRAGGIGDEHVVRDEGAGDAVERGHRLTGARAAHADLPARERGEVEGVQRLAEVEQDVVGRVDDVVDRTDAARLEA